MAFWSKAWWNPSSWFGGWGGLQTKRELAAIDHLKRALQLEEQEIAQMLPEVVKIEEALTKNDIATAERYLPNLIAQLKRKGKVDQFERIDFKVFEKTLFRDLKRELKGAKLK